MNIQDSHRAVVDCARNDGRLWRRRNGTDLPGVCSKREGFICFMTKCPEQPPLHSDQVFGGGLWAMFGQKITCRLKVSRIPGLRGQIDSGGIERATRLLLA